MFTLFRRPPPPEPSITPRTPTDVAVAMLNSWQRQKELDFAASLEALIVIADREGLEKRRIVRVVEAVGKVASKVGGSGP